MKNQSISNTKKSENFLSKPIRLVSHAITSDPCTKMINNTLVLLPLLIMLYEIPGLRAFCKGFVKWIEKLLAPKYTPDITGFIVRNFVYLEEFALGICCICLVISFISKKIKSNNDKKLVLSNDADGFERSLFNYLNNHDTDRCYLVSGEWGSGKTHTVNAFIKKYYSNSNKKVYRLSCFGLNNRQEIIEVLNTVIENQSSFSINSLISNYISSLPVVGNYLSSVLKKRYTYSSIEANSIFIFDNFERLTSRPINRKVDSSTEGLVNVIIRNGNSDSITLRDSLKNVTHELSALSVSLQKSVDKADYEQYVAVVGLINELIETYNQKVIIICSTEVLGERFVSDILRSKLNCIEYIQQSSPSSVNAIISQIQDSYEVEGDRKADLISSFINSIDSEAILKIDSFQNLRLFRNLIEAFVITAMLFSEKDLSEEGFLSSLFFSILITHFHTNRGNYNELILYNHGTNILLQTC